MPSMNRIKLSIYGKNQSSQKWELIFSYINIWQIYFFILNIFVIYIYKRTHMTLRKTIIGWSLALGFWGLSTSTSANQGLEDALRGVAPSLPTVETTESRVSKIITDWSEDCTAKLAKGYRWEGRLNVIVPENFDSSTLYWYVIKRCFSEAMKMDISNPLEIWTAVMDELSWFATKNPEIYQQFADDLEVLDREWLEKYTLPKWVESVWSIEWYDYNKASVYNLARYLNKAWINQTAVKIVYWIITGR